MTPSLLHSSSSCCLALLTLLGASFVNRSAHADTLSQCDFSDTSALVLNGSAAQSGTVLALTDGGSDEAGSAFYGVAIPWTSTTSFHTDFQFQIGSAEAEGLSFILESVGNTALGGDSYQIGYGGITPSVEVEFDTYKDSWDPNANHVGIMTNGAYKMHLATGTPTFTMAGGGVLYAWIDYDGATTELDVYLSTSATEPSTPIVSTAVAISGTGLFVGFTSGSGSVTLSEQDVFEWEFSTDGVPCACVGAAACSGATPDCSTSGPSAGLCVAASLMDAGMDAPDAEGDIEVPDGEKPDGEKHDGETPDVVVTHDSGLEGGKKDGGTHDGGTHDGGAGSGAGSSAARLSGGACAHASTGDSADAGPYTLAVICGLALLGGRRRQRGTRGK